MKRKVIQLAGKTLVVSLPSAWARSQGIVKGQEIDLIEDGPSVIISSKKAEQKKNKELDVSALDEILGRTVGGAYKAGYDEIRIRFESSKQLSEIQRVIARSCLGFEIIEQGAHHVIVKEVSALSPEEFDNVLRRLFLFLLQSADSSLSAAEKNDYESLRAIIVADDSINRLSDFCRRLINRNCCKSFKRPAPLYSIVESLERIGDSYKEICRVILDKGKRISPEILSCHKALNCTLRKFYETFYSFELSNLEDFGLESMKTLKAIEKQINNAKHSDYELFSEIKIAAEKIFELNSSLIALKI